MLRTYRWLLLTLAAFGLTADQTSKYGVFRWLYNDGHFKDTYSNWRDVVPGWFKLIAQFDPDAPKCDCGFDCLQTWSAPVLPHVNQGALFGMGGSKKGNANNFFAGVSVVAALAIVIWGLRKNTAQEPWLMAALGPRRPRFPVLLSHRMACVQRGGLLSGGRRGTLAGSSALDRTETSSSGNAPSHRGTRRAGAAKSVSHGRNAPPSVS
jgi:lipoprotein signal peptidase